MERTAAARTRDAPRRRAAVTMEQIEAFLRSLERRGRAAGTIQAYVPFSLLESYRQGVESVFGAGSCYVLSFRQAGGTKVLL